MPLRMSDPSDCPTATCAVCGETKRLDFQIRHRRRQIAGKGFRTAGANPVCFSCIWRDYDILSDAGIEAARVNNPALLAELGIE